MAFTLEKVVPWGRSYDEYISMFSLSDGDLEKQILGCGDGPAGFNAEFTRRGGRVISVDPIYQFSVEEIKARIEETHETVLEQARRNRDEFIWTYIKDIDELAGIRMGAMQQFLSDYPGNERRYVAGELPGLGFPDNSFELALCSHFLFLYSEQLSEDFHIQSVIELCRVAQEVRIFPLLELGARKSRHLDGVVIKLDSMGYECEVRKVKYEFQKGGNEMLVVNSSGPVPGVDNNPAGN